MITTASPLSAQNQKALFVACENSQILGLYKQCQEVTILQTTDVMARVFTKTEKKVLSLPLSQIFRASPLESHARHNHATKVAIPGAFLWNNTPEGFQSLCSARTIDSSELLEVTCGRHKNEFIKRTKVYRIESYLEAPTQRNNLTH